MKYGRILGLAVALLGCALMATAPSPARAAGTASGTTINNSATVDYDVLAVAQTTVNSNVASFLVDNKIDLTVATTDGAAVSVVPGQTDGVLTYSVTNTGNTVQDYSLTAAAAAGVIFGVTDNFNPDNVEVYVDGNANDTYESGSDTATYIDELAADATITVFIVSDFALSQADGDAALYDLVAQTAVGGTASSQGADITTDDSAAADIPGTVQRVFADGAGTGDAANDGQHSSRDAYEVVTATIAAVKSAAVISDPINGGSNPKAIPGATIRYTITVTNSGSEDADAVVTVDAIPTNCTYSAGTITLDTVSKTDAGADDEVDYNVTNAGAVTVTVSSLLASGGDIDITFDVTID